MSKSRTSSPSTLRVSLAAVPNFDYAPGRHQSQVHLAQRWAAAADLRDASRIVRQFIEANELGGGNFVGGEVIDSHGNLVGHVSYNGRIWDRTPGSPGAKEILPNPTLESRERRSLVRSMIMQVRGGKLIFLGETLDGKHLSVGPYHTATGPEDQYAVFYGNVPFRTGSASESVGLFVSLAVPETIRQAPGWQANPANGGQPNTSERIDKSGTYVFEGADFARAAKLLKPLAKEMTWSAYGRNTSAMNCILSAGPSSLMLIMVSDRHGIRVGLPGRVIGAPPDLFFSLTDLADNSFDGAVHLSAKSAVKTRTWKDYSGKEHTSEDAQLTAKVTSPDATFELSVIEPPPATRWFPKAMPMKVGSMPAPVLEQLLHATKFVADMVDEHKEQQAGITFTLRGAGESACHAQMVAAGGPVAVRAWAPSCDAWQNHSGRLTKSAPACLVALASAEGEAPVEIFSVPPADENQEHFGLSFRRHVGLGSQVVCEVVTHEKPSEIHGSRILDQYLAGAIAGEIVAPREPLVGTYDRCAQLRECWEDGGSTTLASRDGFIAVGLANAPRDSWPEVPAVTRGHALDDTLFTSELMLPTLRRITSDDVVLGYYVLEEWTSGETTRPMTESSRLSVLQVRGAVSPFVQANYVVMPLAPGKDQEQGTPVSGPVIERTQLPEPLIWSETASKITRPKRPAPPAGEPKADVVVNHDALSAAIRLIRPLPKGTLNPRVVVSWSESILTIGFKILSLPTVDHHKPHPEHEELVKHRHESAVTYVTLPCSARTAAQGQFLVHWDRLTCAVSKLNSDWGFRQRGEFVDMVTTDLPAIPAVGQRIDPAAMPEEILRLPKAPSKLGTTLAEPLCAALEAIYPYMSKDVTRGHLNSILLDSDNESVRLVATDGHRMARADTALPMRAFDKHEAPLIPATMVDAMMALCKLKPLEIAWSIGSRKRVSEYSESGKPIEQDYKLILAQSEFDTPAGKGNVTLFSERPFAFFPAYEQVIPNSVTWTLTFDRKTMLASAKKIGKMLGKKSTSGVRFDVSDDNTFLTLSAQTDGKDISVKVPGSGSGRFKPVAINHKYAIEALERLTSDEVSLGGSDVLDPVLLMGKFTPYVHLTNVIMPMRGADDKSEARLLTERTAKPVSRPRLPATSKKKAKAIAKSAKPASKPAAVKPASKPASVKPASKPASVKPASVKPASVKPASKPASVKPASKPASVKPASVKPAVRIVVPPYVMLNELRKLPRDYDNYMRIGRNNRVYLAGKAYRDPDSYDAYFIAVSDAPLAETDWVSFHARSMIAQLQDPNRRPSETLLWLMPDEAMLEFAAAAAPKLMLARADAPGSGEQTEHALRQLSSLEGSPWGWRQRDDRERLRDPRGFYSNVAAWQALAAQGEAFEDLLKTHPLDELMSLVYPGTGVIEGGKFRLYVVMPDGELVLLADSATPSFQDRARTVMRVL